MGIWQTNNASFKVNIGQLLIGKLKSEGCRFCWVKDNQETMIEYKKKLEEECKERPVFEVITSDGDTVKGCIGHMVNEWCSGTSLVGWFIICPVQNITVE